VGEPTREYVDASLSGRQMEWVVQATRLVPVPAGLAPRGFDCNTFFPEKSAGCLRNARAVPEAIQVTTPTGTYPPALYVLPGWAALRGTSPVSALLAGRAASALVCLVLLAGLFAALWREEQGALSLVGPTLALTPLAVALSATLNTSGPEILSGMAFFAALLCLTRSESPPRWVWGFAAGAGAVLALSRSMGAVWVAAEVLLVGVLKGAVMVMADLARALTVPVTMDWMAVSSYGSGTKSSGVVRILKDLDTDLTGKHVLIVEDIIDSGLTLSWLSANLGSRGPESVRIATLLRKPTAAKVDVEVGWVGFDIGEQFVVGYGLDYAERYRNLRDIGVLAPHMYG